MRNLTVRRDRRRSIAARRSSAITHPKGHCVFILHGRDPARDALASFLWSLGLRVLVLEDSSSSGRTLIESILHALKSADFAIALFTGDDEGHLAGHPETKKLRVRQNVLVELGLAIGILGRRRVLILYRENVELPSDLQGIVYVPFTRISDVKLRIVAELKASGIDVDANKAFE